MDGVTFSHPQLPVLGLRFAPMEVDWTFNLNTSETPTYAGQVIQILSVNFENFIISGQFGREGRSDYELKNGAWTRIASPSLTATSKYGPALTQMTEWFKSYFAIASQGTNGRDNFNEEPVTITYQGASHLPVDNNKLETSWKVYPTSFPSYKIANDNFAPTWRVECQVYEAPQEIVLATKDDAISRLTYAPLYQPGSKWSDPSPVGPNATQAQIRAAAEAALNNTLSSIDHFRQLLPTYTESDIENLLQRGFSTPATSSVSSAKKVTDSNQGDPFTTPSLIPGVEPFPGVN